MDRIATFHSMGTQTPKYFKIKEKCTYTTFEINAAIVRNLNQFKNLTQYPLVQSFGLQRTYSKTSIFAAAVGRSQPSLKFCIFWANKAPLRGKSNLECERVREVFPLMVPANSNYERIISRRCARLRSCTLYELLSRLQYGGRDTRIRGNKSIEIEGVRVSIEKITMIVTTLLLDL